MATFNLRKNGYIYLVHWVDRRTALRLSTKLKIESDNWNKEKSRPKDQLATYNGKNILTELNKYETALTKALINYSEPSVEELKGAILSYIAPEQAVKASKATLTEYFDTFIQEVKARKQSNYKQYRACQNHIKEFSGGKKVPFSSVDMKFYKRFNQYLIDKALSMNTISNQFKLLKAVMQSAYMEGLHKNLKFRHFKRHIEQSDSIYLTEEELERIYNLNLSGTLDRVRDFFIVGAFTGLRFEDWHKVTLDSVKDNILTIRTSKTDEKSIIPLHPYVKSILEKYEGIMPRKMSNQKMNEYLRIVACRAEIDKPTETRITKGGEKQVSIKPKCDLVTTHTARRSLATNLILRGVSPFVVMKVTGHRSMSSFERYVKLQELQAVIELKELDFFK